MPKHSLFGNSLQKVQVGREPSLIRIERPLRQLIHQCVAFDGKRTGRQIAGLFSQFTSLNVVAIDQSISIVSGQLNKCVDEFDYS